jgi:hypothetical protein
MRAEDKLRASISRTIYAGSARLFNLAFRRLQLPAAQDLPVSSFRFSSLLAPYAVDYSTRAARRDPRWSSLSEASLPVRLAAALSHPVPANKPVLFYSDFAQQTTYVTCPRSSAAYCRNIRNTNDNL